MLDFRTYFNNNGACGLVPFRKHDVNIIPAKERYEMAYARGRCWEIIFWAFHFYEVFDNETGERIDGLKDVAKSYLGHLGSTIIQFKRWAAKSDIEAEEQFSEQSLARQVRLCFQGVDGIPPIQKDPENDDYVPSLDFPGRERYGVRSKVNPEPFSCKYDHLNLNILAKQCLLVSDNILELGSTEADGRFFKYNSAK